MGINAPTVHSLQENSVWEWAAEVASILKIWQKLFESEKARRGDFSSKAVLINLIHHDKFTIQYERWGCLKMPFSVIQGWKKVCLKQRWKHHKPKSVIRIWTVAGWDNARDRPRRRRHLAPPHRVHTDGNWLSTLARVLPERASKEAEVLPAHTIWQNSICGSWFVKENLWLFFNNSALAC